MSERGLIEDDQRARADALDVIRSFIVQAPAGSGKTELLIQRYLTLLATVDEPEEVIAITFTRKATAEMRVRVIEALRAARRGDEPSQPHLKITAAAAGRVLERGRERGWRLIRNPRRLRIQTLDALNGSVARMQPLTAAATGGAARVADENELGRLYDDAAAATLDWIAERDDVAAATREVLTHIDTNTAIYTGYLARMLKTRDQWLPFVRDGTISDTQATVLRASFEHNLETIIEAQLKPLAASCPERLATELKDLANYAIDKLVGEGKTDAAAVALGRDAAIPSADADALDRWRALAEFLLTMDGSPRKRLTKNEGFPAGKYAEKTRMLDLLDELSRHPEFTRLLHETRELPPRRYSDEQWSVLLALFRLLPVAVFEFRRLCSSRGITDHIEIAISAGEALGSAENPGDVALLLDYQVRHILVDEMQDTSKAQYRMLEALTGGWQADDGRTLFCVGDPMQSIYRFRNAEVAQFLLARESGIGSVRLEPLVLRRNFRSGERLVDWFNAVFPGVLAPEDDPMSGAVSYSTATSVKGLAGQGQISVHPVLDSDVAAEAACGVGVIRDILAGDEARDSRIAVLVRSRTQLPALLSGLRDAGILYEAVDIDRLTDLPEVIECLALVRAATHRSDRVAWLGLLRAPWIGLDWTDLHALVHGRPREAVWDLIRDADVLAGLSARARDAIARAVPALEELVAADLSTRLYERVERAWFRLGGPALLADRDAVNNVQQFFDTIARLEEAGSIADVARLPELLDAERVSTTTAARVKVLTMHKAKGLQFEHVVLYGLGRHPASSQKALMTWFDLPDVHGGEDKILSPVGRRDTLEADPLHRYIGRVEARKDDHEQARLLYVACTRAMQSLHLVGHVARTRDGASMGTPHARSLLRLLWPAVEADFADGFEQSGDEAAIDEPLVLVEPELRCFDRPWSAPDAPDLPGLSDDVPAGGADTRIEFDWVGADARTVGTIVHRWLERAASGRFRLEAAAVAATLPTSIRWAREDGSTAGEAEAIGHQVIEALTRMLEDDKGRWIVDGPGENELALTGSVDGRIENVVLDRVRIDDDGTHWIIDYKTGTHLGGDLEGFIATEVERYTPQLARYAAVYGAYSDAPLRCALYFPLLGRFEEVTV